MAEKNTALRCTVPRPLISLTQCVKTLDRILRPGVTKSFRETLGAEAGAARVVSFFAAVLELMKRGWLVAEQKYPLGEISMRRTERWTEDA